MPLVFKKQINMEYKDLIIPTLNVNDTKVIISDIQKKNLEYIEEGEILYCVETSKVTEDYHVDFSGYVVLFVEDLDEVSVGQSAGMIFKSLDGAKAKLAEIEMQKTDKLKLSSVNASKKAIAYAKEKDVDITKIKKTGIIKTEDIDKYLESTMSDKNVMISRSESYTFDTTSKRVAIIGGGRGTMQVLDLISHIDGFRAVRIYEKDKSKHGTEVYGVPVVYEESMDDLINDFEKGIFDYVVNGIGGSTKLRKKYYDTLTASGLCYTNLIHPSAIIGQGVKIGSGNIILPMCHIGPEAKIGNDCFITAKTSIEHHNIIGSHCTFGPGVMFSGSVEVGDCVKFAAGIYAEPLVKIGNNCLISSGTILTKDVPENTVVRHQQQIEFVDINKFR